MSTKTAIAFIHRMSDFSKLGLNMDMVQAWEDGMRTDGHRGTFEWWYFDSKLEDGTTLVIVFYTKNMFKVQSLINPMISITLTSESGETLIDHVITASRDDFSASREYCDVRIGQNKFSGNLKNYRIIIDSPEIRADITLEGTVPPYRAGTGHAFFHKNNKETFFAWLNAVPQGKVNGSLTINNSTKEISGSGYHDHNWGDAPMPFLLHHWYWGRAEIGDYTVISSHMTSAKTFGHTHASTFLLTHKDKILAYDPRNLNVKFEDVYIDKATGKPVANKIKYIYEEDANLYIITYSRERDISNTPFIDKLNGVNKLLAKLLRFDGSYLRFAGQVTLEVYENNLLLDTASDSSAVWELMYFGHPIEHE